MRAPNRAPGTAWFLRPPPTYPNGYVTTESGDEIQVVFSEREGSSPAAMYMSRRDARLLAKRINQCLDETVKP